MKQYVKTFENFISDKIVEQKPFSDDDLMYDIADHIQSVVSEFDETQVKPLEFYLFGSRLKGTAKPDSDLDVLFIYEGDMKSHRLQDALNEDIFEYKYQLDITPVNINEESALAKFREEYDVNTLPKYEFDQF